MNTLIITVNKSFDYNRIEWDLDPKVRYLYIDHLRVRLHSGHMKDTTLNSMRSLMTTAVVLLLFTIGAFSQTVDSLVVVPQNPTTSNEVSVHIYGWLWSPNVYIVDISVSQGSYSFTLDVDCQAPGIGLPVLVPFDTIINFGMLSAHPNWIITVNTFLSGNLQESSSTQFSVSDPTEIQRFYQSDQASNYPNPFINRTNFKFSLIRREMVELVVFDILGAEKAVVISRQLPPGDYDIPLDTRELTPGKYFYQLTIGGILITRQIYRSAG